MDVGLFLCDAYTTTSKIDGPQLLPETLGFNRVLFSVSVFGDFFERIVTPDSWRLFGEKAKCWMDNVFGSDMDGLASSEVARFSDDVVRIKVVGKRS